MYTLWVVKHQSNNFLCNSFVCNSMGSSPTGASPTGSTPTTIYILMYNFIISYRAGFSLSLLKKSKKLSLIWYQLTLICEVSLVWNLIILWFLRNRVTAPPYWWSYSWSVTKGQIEKLCFFKHFQVRQSHCVNRPLNCEHHWSLYRDQWWTACNYKASLESTVCWEAGIIDISGWDTTYKLLSHTERCHFE